MRLTNVFIFILFFCFHGKLSPQDAFNYDLLVTPVTVPGLPGLHSYAFGVHQDKWLIIGGRKDGLHARQPFNAFPQAFNNTDIYVVNVNSQSFWSASVNTLPATLKEQLQSTNMNFYQDADTLYIIGGYAYAPSANDHITFPGLISLSVSGLVNAIIAGTDISQHFKYLQNDIFAVTGGQFGKIDNTFYLVGGHRFDGNYNPFGFPTYTQTYTSQIRKFTINNSGTQLSFGNYQAITDTVHLHRRDYNLLPQIFPDGSMGYTVSSGVFQVDEDLPFLYPVDINAQGYSPITEFNQYLSNYHSAKVCLFDSQSNQMHSLFFGGMSQYYYQNGQLIQDNLVPFTKTISRLTRYADSTLQEFVFPVEMPLLHGASAEFIINTSLPHTSSKIILLSEIQHDTILTGYIFGGIHSPIINPFAQNQTNQTSASATIYAVKLIRNNALLPGDANCDGLVNLLDLITLSSYILQLNPSPFCFENADVNQDQQINILDIISTAELILGGSFHKQKIPVMIESN